MHRVLERQYPPEAIYSFGADAHASVREFVGLPQEERAQIRLLRGHMPFGLHQYLPGDVRYFTILRDPVARVVSYYNFIRRTPQHYLYDTVTSENLSLHELLARQIPLMMNDGQVRLLSGVWGEVGFGEVSAEMLRQAQDHLQQHFAVVGLTEEFDTTLWLLSRTFGWNADLRYERQNVSKSGLDHTALPEETVRLIEACNRQDLSLYRYGQELFRRQVRAQGLRLPLQMVWSRARQRGEPLYWRLRRHSLRAFIRRALRIEN